MSNWTREAIGDQTGRRFLLTGVTGGLGTEIARELARAGASLLVTARNAVKADAAVTALRRDVPNAEIEVIELDLADLASVERAASTVLAGCHRLDALINNAGIMIPPLRHTVQGFELQMGTNHLGHFAFTARLWPLLVASDARVVSVSSLAHTTVKGLDLRVLTAEGSPRRYRRWPAYGESKLANLVFAQELHRRKRASGTAVVSTAAHPGIATTELTRTGWGLGGAGLIGTAMHHGTKLIAQSARAGAEPILLAATDPTLCGGEYFGPQGFRGVRGRPGPSAMTRAARDPELGRRLWTASENASGVTFSLS